MTLGVYGPCRCACGADADPIAGQCEACFTRDYDMANTQGQIQQLEHKLALYGILADAYRDLVRAGKAWVAASKTRGGCACGDCAECALVAAIEEVPEQPAENESYLDASVAYHEAVRACQGDVCKQCGSRDLSASRNEPIKCGKCDTVREM